jgi:hypothetical protein
MNLIPAILLSLLLAAPAPAQRQCLHGPDETAEESARRRDAVGAARLINTLQARTAKGTNRYLAQEELTAAAAEHAQNQRVPKLDFSPGQDVMPGWELKLSVTKDGYWFMIKDKSDPCGFAYISNQEGVIYNAEPIR